MPKTTFASHLLMHSVGQSDRHPHREVENFDEATKALKNPQPSPNPELEAYLRLAKQKGEEQQKMLQGMADELNEAVQKGQEAADREQTKQQEKVEKEKEARVKLEKDLEQEAITGEKPDNTPEWRRNTGQKEINNKAQAGSKDSSEGGDEQKQDAKQKEDNTAKPQEKTDNTKPENKNKQERSSDQKGDDDKAKGVQKEDDKSQQGKADKKVGEDQPKQTKPDDKSSGKADDKSGKDQKDDGSGKDKPFADQVEKLSDAISKGREAAQREVKKQEAKMVQQLGELKKNVSGSTSEPGETDNQSKEGAEKEAEKKEKSGAKEQKDSDNNAGATEDKSADENQQKTAKDFAKGAQDKADKKVEDKDEKKNDEKNAQGDAGKDQSKAGKDAGQAEAKNDNKEAKKDVKKDDKSKKPSGPSKAEIEKRAHELHPQFYEEIARRRAGMTPKEEINDLASIERPHNEDFDKDDEDILGEVKLARKVIRQNELDWRERQKSGLDALHRIQMWQEREIQEAEETREAKKRQEHEHVGVFESVLNFASSKWNNLMHGKENDKQHDEKDLRGFDSRHEERDDRRAHRSTRATPPTTPLTPASGRRALSERNQQMDFDDRFDGVEQTRQAENNKSSSWFFGNLQHFAPQWSANGNTRFIDTLTDDELSMMSL